MSEILKCDRCGASLQPDAPEGLCPRCLLALNLATQTDIPGETGGNRPAPAPPLPVAEVAKLFPQLEIIECLGRGGMGAVYKARQPRLDRFVALKILSPEKQGNQKFSERFEREARALAKLHHPNIVSVHDFGETQGNFYLLMEYVDGATLRQLIRGRKLASQEALEIVPKICEALQYAHGQGIVHRDIKPENILIDKNGTVKIADFGIAKILGDNGSANLTAEQVIGTPHYMSPEQIEKPQTVDHRADIYSLGVVFYEMLTGELPLGKFPPPSQKVQVDMRLDEVVLRALEKEPERRFQHASEVKSRVETIAANIEQREQRLTAGRSSLLWPALAAGLAIVLLAIYFTVTLSNLRKNKLAKEEERPGALRLTNGTLLMVVAAHPRADFPTEGSNHLELIDLSTGRFSPPPANAINPATGLLEAPLDGATNAATVLQQADDLMNEGRYEESLERRLWYYDHALESGDPYQHAVRLSSSFINWVELGRRYPPAKKALLEIRDRDTQRIENGGGYFELFQELYNINNQLQDDKATYAVYKTIEQSDPQLAGQCFVIVQGLVAQQGDYETYLKYAGDPQSSFESVSNRYQIDMQNVVRMRAMYAETAGQMAALRKRNHWTNLPAYTPPDTSAMMDKNAKNQFAGQVRQLIEVLVATGSKSEAENIQQQALAVVDVPQLHSAVEDVQEKIAKQSEPDSGTSTNH